MLRHVRSRILGQQRLGGVHDLGSMDFDSVTKAPDAPAGAFTYYNSQETFADQGHVYVIVTKDGAHYAKLQVTWVTGAGITPAAAATPTPTPAPDEHPSILMEGVDTVISLRMTHVTVATRASTATGVTVGGVDVVFDLQISDISTQRVTAALVVLSEGADPTLTLKMAPVDAGRSTTALEGIAAVGVDHAAILPITVVSVDAAQQRVGGLAYTGVDAAENINLSPP